ncbi:MAG TPA: DNA polymerase/3'-5' exonuclease PolX [Blastocatellia bacterium]
MSDPNLKYEGKLAIDNREVANVLNRIADLLEFNDENPFKLRSYRMAAETVDEMEPSVAEMAARGGPAELQKIPGIGKSISALIAEIVQTGTSSYLQSLADETPESVLDLRRVSGVGLKTSQTLFREFGIKSLEDLKAFAEGGGLASVAGLGEKTIVRIKSSLARIESERGLMRLNDALDLGRAVMERLLDKDPAALAEIVGQVRRGREMVEAVEVLASGDRDLLVDAFTSSGHIARVRSVNDSRVEAETKKGVTIILHLAPGADFGAALVRTTGAVEHLRDLESEAAARDLSFRGYELFRSSDGRKKRKHKPSDTIRVKDEKEFYAALGLEYVPPELREGVGEVLAAREGRLPRLISLEDIRGDFHMHTTWSDGQNSIREMVEAARLRGYQYIAITDHTQSTSIANGNTPEELLEEIKEIEAVAGEYDDIRVMKGAEVDILSDGSLDLPFEVLDRLDWIVGSIHAGFHQSREQITGRVIRAIETGYLNVVAHPTGRILGERPAYEIDLERIIEAARKYKVRLELNASPYRLDLDSYWLGVAKRAGVGIVISTDSHTTRGFASMTYGVTTARRAWLTRDDVLNTYSLKRLMEEIEYKKACRRAA